jgi:hypothetical protein
MVVSIPKLEEPDSNQRGGDHNPSQSLEPGEREQGQVFQPKR